ncbi:MAG: hypothetical protein SAJ12_19975 [Jaaginema sp. PMC 1079.18]|nr:hypothetical protein [Jaaginema sp. PMC 1080.18]MEC4853265.1 hypothetical protein [Jaaginema sp. PMC 1079.18]MEC4868660.1 hypothetical protein [Jaaginema sp. PMC 1078.18]
MGQRRVQLVILCEDRQQEVFARHFLENRGFKGLFRANICPKGSQSGEQYVRDQYPREVQAYRKNKNRVSIGLVVVIDADNRELQERLDQLEEELGNNDEKSRQTGEAIAIFIPKRNIETWIHYLEGESVDENSEYPKYTKNESACKPYVEQLVEQCNSQTLPNTAPNSLQSACGELQRLLPLIAQ